MSNIKKHKEGESCEELIKEDECPVQPKATICVEGEVTIDGPVEISNTCDNPVGVDVCGPVTVEPGEEPLCAEVTPKPDAVFDVNIVSTDVPQFNYEKSGYVCDPTTDTWICTVYTWIDGVAQPDTVIDSGISCEEPAPTDVELKEIRSCVDGFEQVQFCQITFTAGVAGEPVLVGDPISTGIECNKASVIGVNNVCFETVKVVKVGVEASDFDEGDLEIGDKATSNFSVTVNGGTQSVTMSPIAGVTFVETGYDAATGTRTFDACWTWAGTIPSSPPLTANAVATDGSTSAITSGDFYIGSGGGESLAQEFTTKIELKELCYEGAPSVYQDATGAVVDVSELTLCVEDPIVTYDHEYICNEATDVYDLSVVITTDNVPSSPVIIPTTIVCADEPAPDFEPVRVCNADGFIHIITNQYDADGTVTVLSDIATIEPCIPAAKQIVTVDTCTGTEDVPVDQEVAVRGVVTVKPCPEPVVTTDNEYVCNTDTGFYDQILIITTDGVAAAPVVTATTIPCTEDEPDFEPVRVCNADGFIHIVTTQYNEDATSVVLSDIATIEPCGCETTPETWKSKEYYFGLENSKLSFVNSYTTELLLNNGSVRTIVLPSATSYATQQAAWAAALSALFPELCEVAQHWTEWRSAFLPNQGLGAVPPSDMNFPSSFGRFTQFTACHDQLDFLPVGATITAINGTDLEKPVTPITGVDEGPVKYITHCVACSPECQTEPPKCAIPVGEAFPETPVAVCTSSIVAGNWCDVDVVAYEDPDNTDDPLIQSNILVLATSCDGGVPALEYFTDPNSDGNLVAYDVQGEIRNCDNYDDAPAADPACRPVGSYTGKTFCYEKKSAFRLIEKQFAGAAGSIDVSAEFGLPTGAIIAMNDAALFTGGTGSILAAGINDPVTFTVSGTQPVCIKAMHGGAIPTDGASDGITSNDGAPYTFTGNITGDGTASQSGNDYQVTSVTDNSQGGINWTSTGPATSVTSFTTNLNPANSIRFFVATFECGEAREWVSDCGTIVQWWDGNVQVDISGLTESDCCKDKQLEEIKDKLCDILDALSCDCPEIIEGELTDTDTGSGLGLPLVAQDGFTNWTMPFALEDNDCLAEEITVCFDLGHFAGVSGHTAFIALVTAGGTFTDQSASNSVGGPTGVLGNAFLAVGFAVGDHPSNEDNSRKLYVTAPKAYWTSGMTLSGAAFGSVNDTSYDGLNYIDVEIQTGAENCNGC